MVLRRDEYASDCNQSEYITLSLTSEVWDTPQLTYNVWDLEVGVKSTNTMMESLGLMFELSTQILHPLDVLLPELHVEGLWVVALAKELALLEAHHDLVHGDFSLKGLLLAPNSKNN